jgi:hypothetical protein
MSVSLDFVSRPTRRRFLGAAGATAGAGWLPQINQLLQDYARRFPPK